MSDPKYRVREFTTDGGHIRRIVLECASGSSLLVSLSNFLLLSRPVIWNFQTEGGIKGRPKFVTTEVLMNMIETEVTKILDEGLRQGLIDTSALISGGQTYKYIIGLLPKGIRFDPVFTSCTGFTETMESMLFDVLHARLHHGWLVDPKEDADAAKAIGSKSYNEILAILELALGASSEIASEASSKASSEAPSEGEDNAALIIKNFLDNSKDQLTPYGLRCLHEEIADDGSLKILLKNDHFSLLCKRKGILATLIADEEQLKNHPDAVWKALEEVDGERRLFTLDFIPIKQQVLKPDDKEAFEPKIQKEVTKDGTPEKIKSKPSKKKRLKDKQRQGSHVQTQVKSQEDVKPEEETHQDRDKQPQVLQVQTQENAEPKEETQKDKDKQPQVKSHEDAKPEEVTQEDKDKEPQVLHVQNQVKSQDDSEPPEETQEDKDKQSKEEIQQEKDNAMSQNFIHFLTEFKEEGTNVPFFEGQVKALHHCGSFTMRVDFNDLEKHDKHNARYICNNIPRVSERLRCCVCNYLLDHNEFQNMSTQVFEKTTLEIRGLPRPNSRLPFRKFAMENDMYKTWELFDFDCKKVNAPTYLGRKAGLGYLNFILKKHKAGCCWNGSFVKDDLEVLIHDDGSMEFVITKKCTEDLTQEKGIADFNKFCELIFPCFMNAEVDGMPAYFDQFQCDYLENMPDPEDKEAYDKWQKYMSSHFAFKSPQAISTLITETFEVCDSVRTEARYTLLDCTDDISGWVDIILTSGSLSLNDTYQYGVSNTGINHYDESTYWRLLMFGRHFTRHMLRSKKDEGIIIKVQDLVIVHLMLAHVLEGLMAKLIWFIMKNNNFDGGLFSSAWRHFQASETFDEAVKEELNTSRSYGGHIS